jgi:cytidine deaminase
MTTEAEITKRHLQNVSLVIFQGLVEFSAIAISAELEGDFCGPCGACRQFMCEFNPDLDIYLVRVQDLKVQVTDLGTIFPDSFTPKRLNLKFFNGV